MWSETLKLIFNSDPKVDFYFSQRRKVGSYETRKLKVLVEAYQVPSNEIAIDYFLEVFCKKYNAQPMGYRMIKHRRFGRLVQQVRFYFSTLRKIGCTKLVYVPYKKRNVSDIALKVVNLDNKELIKLEYKGVLFGDLFYDYYLSQSGEYTINEKSPRLLDFANEFFQYVDEWFNIFEKFEVAAICVSHTVYHFGIPARIGISRGIPSFQVTLEQIHRINRDYPMANLDHKIYEELFANLGNDVKEMGIRRAEVELEQRFQGRTGSDIAYLPTAAYSVDETHKNVLRSSSKIKILVATHDFWDSPHVYGQNFHSDFYEWLLDLGNLADRSDYDWYIKMHPYLRGGGELILEEFVSTRPKFTLLGKNTSHNQIINSGIDFALTVYGSVALEYAMFGIPVINGSRNGPYAQYGFSVTPNDLGEYREVVLNLEKLKLEIEKEKILEFHFMKFIYNFKCWMFHDYDEYLRLVGGYALSNTANAFHVFAHSKMRVPDSVLLQTLEKFLHSDDPRLDRRHFPADYQSKLKI